MRTSKTPGVGRESITRSVEPPATTARPRWASPGPLASLPALARVALLAVTSLLLAPAPAVAQKGGGATATPGTVMFDVTHNAGTDAWFAEQWGVRPDGTAGKAAFRHKFQRDSSRAVPSSLVYGADPVLHRWWLAIADVQVEGATRAVREVFACRPGTDGTLQRVQLTALYPHVTLPVNQPAVTWSNDGRDTFLSFKGHTYGEGNTAETPRDQLQPGDIRLHVFRLNLSGADVQAAFAQGVDPKVGATSLRSVLETDLLHEDAMEHHHWAPDGSRLVYFMRDGLWVATVPPAGAAWHGGPATFLARPANDSNPAVWPAWSPDGQRIAFSGSAGIYTISPDGTGVKLVLAEGKGDSYGVPVWSPDSRHLAVQHTRYKGWTANYFVSRVPAGGGSVTVLTSGMDPTQTKRLTGWPSNVQAP